MASISAVLEFPLLSAGFGAAAGVSASAAGAGVVGSAAAGAGVCLFGFRGFIRLSDLWALKRFGSRGRSHGAAGSGALSVAAAPSELASGTSPPPQPVTKKHAPATPETSQPGCPRLHGSAFLSKSVRLNASSDSEIRNRGRL